MKEKLSREEILPYSGRADYLNKSLFTDGDGGGLLIDGDGYIFAYGYASGIKDMSFDLTPTRQGALNKPEYDYTNLGLLFPQNDADEIAYLETQINHDIKLGSKMNPHIHWIQAQEDAPVWKIDYRLIENGVAPGAWVLGEEATGEVFTYPGSGSIMQISVWPEITVPSSVSAQIDIKLYRDDNVVTGNVLAKYFDIHVEIDSFGSKSEYKK